MHTYLSSQVQNSLVTSKIAIDSQRLGRNVLRAVDLVKQIPCNGAYFLKSKLDTFNDGLRWITGKEKTTAITDKKEKGDFAL